MEDIDRRGSIGVLARDGVDLSSESVSRLRLRAAVLADAAAIARLMDELGYPTDADAMHARLRPILDRTDYYTIVAELDERVVGVAGITTGWLYERDGAYGRLVALSVAEDVRGRGIGGALVEAAERWLRSRGARRVIVNSGDHRIDAHDFYARRGYTRTGVRFVKDLSTMEDRDAERPGKLESTDNTI